MLTVLLLLWQHLVHAPQHTRTLAAYSPLLGLEAELAQLRESAAALSAPENKTDSSSALILNPQEAFTVLEELKAKIGAHAWQFTYQLGEPEDPAPETPLLRSLRVRAKLTPTPQSSESFQQLMQVLPLFSQQSKRLELMRLTLRADEKENLQADLNLRFTLHAPTPAPAP